MSLKALKIITVVIMCTCVAPCFSKELTVGAYHYPPFMDQYNLNGIYLRLAKAIEEQTDLTLEWRFYPYARLDRLFSLGKIDMEIGSSPIWHQNKDVPGLFTDYFYRLEDVSVFRQGEDRHAESLEDIKGQDIGMVRGYSFPQFTHVFQQNLARRIEAADEVKLLELLTKRRIDQVFMSKQVFLSLKQKHPEFSDLMMGNVVGQYDVAIRVHPDQAEIIPVLNRALSALKQLGTIDQLFGPFSMPIKKPAEAGHIN